MDRTKKTVFLPHNAESMSGFGRHPLIYVPSFNTKISFQWKMLFPGSSDSSNHHSPYRVRQNKLVGDQCLTSDKFVLFRSDGATVKFEFELSGGDACANWVALRIDVLPWFTHLNSTATYPSQDGEKAEPFPPLRSIAIKVSVSELKVATWFAGEDEVDEWGMDELGGVCLILRRVNYSASVEGTKEIKIEGPVKAALLDLSDFKMESQTRSDEMLEIETLAAELGAPNCDTTVNNIHDYCYDSEPSLADGKSPFLKLEVLSRDIDELDYLFITGQIDIQNKSLERILSGSDDVNPKAEDPNAMDCVGQGLAVVDKSTWSILVSRLKLLWTIEIRDALMVIIQDLIFTVGFMKSQIRQSQVLAEKSACQEDPNIKRGRDRPVSFSGIVGDGVELSSQASPRDDGDLARSKLEYLLERDEGFEINIAHDGDHSIHTTHSENGNNLESVPTLDIHFSNPQVQLHSKTTGGSVILAMEGAHVEGRKFANLLVERGQNKSGKILPCDLIRKTGMFMLCHLIISLNQF